MRLCVMGVLERNIKQNVPRTGEVFVFMTKPVCLFVALILNRVFNAVFKGSVNHMTRIDFTVLLFFLWRRFGWGMLKGLSLFWALVTFWCCHEHLTHEGFGKYN